MVDAISGHGAVMLGIHSFQMHEEGRAEALATYQLGMLWCGGGTYSLEFRLGSWEVTDPATPIIC